MAVIIGHAGSDENGQISGGQAGDQRQKNTPDYGGECYMREWWLHNLGWRVFRCKDAKKADMIAQDMEWACNNPNIGYDQGQNQTLLYAAAKVDYNCSKVTTPCETDCARLVRVCVLYAGIAVSDFYTGIEAKALMATGEFEELTEAKYTTSSEYLKRGDILVTKTTGHTCVVLTNGSGVASTKLYDKDLAGEYTVTTALNMRSGAGTEHKVVEILKKDETVICRGFYEIVNGTKWLFIEHGSKTGCVNSKYLKFKNKLPEETVSSDIVSAKYFDKELAGKYMTTTQLNLRRGAGTGYKIVKVLPKNATVQNYGYYNLVQSSKWLLVKYGEVTGYCSTKYLKKS